MSYVIITTIVLLLIVFVTVFIHVLYKENFSEPTEIGSRYVCPTTNQSYDLRGDIVIPRKSWPIYNSTIGSFQPYLCTYNKLE